MAIKFKVGRVKAIGLAQFAHKELNNPKFLKKIGLNRIYLSKKNVEKLPRIELFLLNTKQLKDEYHRLRKKLQTDLSYFDRDNTEQRFSAVVATLKARNIKNIRGFREFKSPLTAKREELFVSDMIPFVSKKTRKKLQQKEQRLEKKLKKALSFEIKIEKK